MFKKIPPPPDKDRLIALLNKTHAPGMQHWTTGEAEEMFKALKTVAFYWYRDERFL